MKSKLAMALSLTLLAALLGTAHGLGGVELPGETGALTLWITATQEGRAVTDLKKEDLQVWIGKQEQLISSLTFNPPVPVRVGLLVDMSKSRLAGWPTPEVNLGGRFFRTVMQAGDQAFILYFNDGLFVDADVTTDIGELDRGLSHLAGLTPAGGTALYDAVALACEKREASGPTRRALVVITDGEDNSSMRTRDEAMAIVRKTGTQLYAVGAYLKRGRGEPILQEMARSTGGVYFRTQAEPEMESAFNSIAKLLRAQYALEFQPAAGTTGKKERHLKIKCTRLGVQILAPEDF